MRYLFYALLFLLVFIPLYPKLPLVDVAFTWTYVRLEDVLVAVVYLGLGYLVWRKKARIHNILFWPIIVFWLVGLISTLINLPFLENGDGYVTYKPHLVVVHYLRRIEYLGLFFVAFAAVRSRLDVLRVTYAVIGTFAAVVVYALGQQYLGFPQFLTMNEEFAKGVPLPLQEGARVSATFGGHYDLGGYLVLIIPMIVALAVAFRNWKIRIGLAGLAFLGFWVMLSTSSRISFGALLLALGLVVFALVKHKKQIVMIGLVLVVVTVLLGRDTILDRFAKTVRLRQVTFDPLTQQVLEPPTRDKDWGGLPESDSALLIPFTPIEATSSAYKVFKYSKSDYEELLLENPNLDVTMVQIPQVESRERLENEQANTARDEIIEEVRLVDGEFERRWALVFDISFTTRVQGGWPIAWQAFLSNPVIGRGYSTVTAASDSSYMRALGEVGLAGFVSFFGILVIFLQRAYRYVQKASDPIYRMLVLGISCGVVGLLANALMIDIFEASKVAFVLWMLIGVCVAVIEKDLKGKEHA